MDVGNKPPDLVLLNGELLIHGQATSNTLGQMLEV